MSGTRLTQLSRQASRLRDLHRRGTPLVLVNVWDVASAKSVAQSGAKAIATSSAAVAATLGIPDHPDTDTNAMFAAAARIAASTTLPVSADLLDGYGLDPAELVDRLVETGCVGCNIEDSDHARPGELVDDDTMAERLTSIRAAAERIGVPIVINARVDAYLHASHDDPPHETVELVMQRAHSYARAGADCIYPVRLDDPEVIRAVSAVVDTHINVNPPRGGLRVAAEAGASRVSIGPAAFYRTHQAITETAIELMGPTTARVASPRPD